MDATYEIFKTLAEGPIWIETVKGLEQSRERLESLIRNEAGEYFAFDVHEARIVASVPPDLESAGKLAHNQKAPVKKRATHG